MAFTNVLTDNAPSTPGATSRTTSSSYTPTANALQLAHVTLRNGSITVDPALTGCGLTWVLVKRLQCFTAPQRTLCVYRAMGASPSNGALTVTAGGADTWDKSIITVTEVTGTDTSGTNGSGAVVQEVDNDSMSTATPSINITMTAGNWGFSVWSAYGDQPTATPRASWTELADQQISGDVGHEDQYIVGTDTAGSATWTASEVCAGIVVEIKSASGAFPGQTTGWSARVVQGFRNRITVF